MTAWRIVTVWDIDFYIKVSTRYYINTEVEHEAVDKTIIAWKALAADPKLKKDDIPDLLPDTHQECWLCVPWLNVSAKCPDCPLSGERFHCETKGQPYNVWMRSKGTERQIAALQLIKQCEDWREAHPLKPEKPELVIEFGHVYRKKADTTT